MTATKQRGYDSNGEDEDDNKDDRVTFHNVTISHERGLWWRKKDDNGGVLEAATTNGRRWWWQT